MQTGRIGIVGTTVTTAKVNLRQGAPNTSAPVVQKIPPGVTLSVTAVTVGQAVENNQAWYELADGFVWSGACGPLSPAPTPPPAPPAQPTFPSVPWVVDLYHLDDVSSFTDAVQAGLQGVIHKATTGASGPGSQDVQYQPRRVQAEAAGLLWGATHWGTAADVDQQVTNFLTQANPGPNTLLALDFEYTKNNDMTLDQAVAFLQSVKSKANRSPVLYGGGKLKGALQQGPNPGLQGFRLWLAEYGISQPKLPIGYDSYWLWQYTDGQTYPGHPYPNQVAGIDGNEKGQLDCDFFNGALQDLQSQWAG